MNDFLEGIDVAVTVCDENGTVVRMNAAAREVFARHGGGALVGSDVRACHPEPARSKLSDLLESPRLNAYTIEKDGRKKLVYQVPVFEEGVFRGIAELSLPLPAELPHFVRKPAG